MDQKITAKLAKKRRKDRKEVPTTTKVFFAFFAIPLALFAVTDF
jgi:hypothetical protein